MKYSQLLKMSIEETGYSVFGIEVDEANLKDKFRGLNRMGFVLDNLNVSDVGNHALAVMISYMTTGEFNREIIAEIPSHVEINLQTLLMLSGVKASISLLPPTGEVDSEWEQYAHKLKEVMTVWLSNPNMNRLTYPLVGYFEYLVLEANGYVPESISTDEYMLKRYVDEFPLPRMDVVKDELKIHVHEYFGGVDNFKKFIDTVAVAAQSRADVECQAIIDKISLEQ